MVRNEAFRDHWDSIETTPEGWGHFMSLRSFRPAFSFLAYDGTEPVGMIIGHEYDAYTELTGKRGSYVAIVGTRKAARKRGIASALLTAALRAASDDGCILASLGVDADSPTGAVSIYRRMGFTIRDTTLILVKSLS
jgi:ribosomal protein S18 acetylase RimI-like enzyme